MTGAGSGGMAANGFPTRAPVELEDRPPERQWLVDTLWGEQAVGILGGQPKCGKSILALDLAVAVAAGVPCLRRFAPARPGPVLMFAAEDDGHLVRKRLQGIAKVAGARFETLDIAVIDVPKLRLDDLDHRDRLNETVERIAPRLLILDPLVRLHGGDENAVADVAPILGFLRDIQRRFETAVLLVHHARKSAADRPGQALRGSSELHAWGDSNLYLRRRDRQTLMTVEHRAARGLEDIEIELMEEDGEEPHFRLRQPPPGGAAPQPETPERRILQALAEAQAPLSQRQIRERAATRHKTVGAVLNKLVREGRIRHDAKRRYCLVASQSEKPAPAANGSNPDPDRFPVPATYA
ncbi:MAG: AAA family ATPase [Defluviicoccus sp.]|nr:AAA family ATPase [Defluviicoccus sp.]